MSKKVTFKALQTKWYKKANKEGVYEDIEDSYGLKEWSKAPSEYSESVKEYYRLASQCLYDKKFPSLDYKIVWKLHTEGYTHTEISNTLGITWKQVRLRIDNLKKLFGLSHEAKD